MIQSTWSSKCEYQLAIAAKMQLWYSPLLVIWLHTYRLTPDKAANTKPNEQARRGTPVSTLSAGLDNVKSAILVMIDQPPHTTSSHYEPSPDKGNKATYGNTNAILLRMQQEPSPFACLSMKQAQVCVLYMSPFHIR